MTEAESVVAIEELDPDRTVDNRGRGCANGIVRVQRAIEDLPDGGVLKIRSTDRRAKEEYPQLAEQTTHELLGIESRRTRLVRKEITTYLRIRHD